MYLHEFDLIIYLFSRFRMSGKLLSFVAMLLMMLLQQTEAIQLTTQSVVGNILFEQSTLFCLSLLMILFITITM
jgi:hypothetical protein